MTRLVIVGAAGRMGRAVARAALACGEVRIVGALTNPGSAALGADIGELCGSGPIGVQLTSELPALLDAADVVIDFSVPQATLANLHACHASRKPYLLGTTGVAAELGAEFERAARDIAVLVAPNTSLAIAVLVELVRAAAAALPAQFDIEIIETHHRMKRDAPSGTARQLGEAAASGRGQQLAGVERIAAARGARQEHSIGYAVVRGGDIVGDHAVLFAGEGERLSLSHQATDRAVFAQGALKAALWLRSRSPGQYSMRDFVFENK